MIALWIATVLILGLWIIAAGMAFALKVRELEGKIDRILANTRKVQVRRID